VSTKHERLQGSAPRDLLFAAAGALAIALQVTLLRELIVALSGDEAAIGLGLAAWLSGIAAGAAAARSLAARAPRSWAATGFLLLAVSGPVMVLACRFLRAWLAPPPGELLTTGPSILIALAVLAPPGLLVGIVFTALASAASLFGVAPGRGIARLYVLESLGSLAGGMAITWVVIPNLPPLRGIALLAAACVLAAIPAARRFLPARFVFLAAAVALALLGTRAIGGRLEEISSRARFRGLAPGIPLLAFADTPYQHVAIGGGDDIRHLYSGGQYAGSFPDPVSSETTAHTLACLSPHPRRILAVGGVVLGALRFLLTHPVLRVDIPEPDRKALALVRRYLGREDAAALDDPRVHVIEDDPRRFLVAGSRKYDLILVLTPDPVTLQLARFTTAEFFALAAASLAPDGVLVVGLKTAPNELTGETAAMGGAVFGALRSALPVVHASPGPEGYLVAGRDAESATLDPSRLADRWKSRAIKTDRFVPEMFGVLFPPERVRSQEESLARAAEATPPSRDERPVSFLHALARRQTITGGATGRFIARLAHIPRAVLFVLPLLPCLLLLSAAAGNRGGLLARAAVHAATVTGACGMVWSLLLLFSYQTRAGALYGRIGLLTAIFMLGLAVGGGFASRAASADRPRARTWLVATSALALGFGILLSLSFLLLPAIAGRAVQSSAPFLFALHGALLLAAGFVTGCVFPSSAGALLGADGSTAQLRSAKAAGAIESADHAGAAVAALLASILFIPVFGLTGTASMAVALQAAALALVVSTPRPRG